MPLWTPAFLGAAALVSWLKADAITGLSDGQAVSSWLDSSGHSKNANQAVVGNQPTYRTAVVNGLPAVQFTDVNRFMTCTSMGWAKPVTILAVVQPTSSSPVNISRVMEAGAGFFIRVFDGTGTGVNDWQAIGPTSLEYSIDTYDLNPHIHSVIMDGANSLGALDGAAVTGNTGATALIATLTLGHGGGITLPMYLGEVIVVSGHATDIDRQRAEGYLAAKYGLQTNLPGAHPYKSAAPLVATTLTAGIV